MGRMRDHTTTLVHCPDGHFVDIDDKIVPLIKAFWAAGINTVQSCQDHDGMVWIGLENPETLGRLLTIIGPYMDEDLVERSAMHGEVLTPDSYPEQRQFWRYRILPEPRDEIEVTFAVSLEFPPSDIPVVVGLLETAVLSGDCV